MAEEHRFTRQELIDLFDPLLGQTLGDIDQAHVFDRAIRHPLIKGIAGDVIEKSVLGYGPNSSRDADLIVDDVATEAKTTGLRMGGDGFYEAKEPMSITAVSPNSIWKEEWARSHFWAKLEHLFIVYYHYKADKAVPAIEYMSFPLVGYEFHEWSDEDVEALRRDWQKVHDFFEHIWAEERDQESREERYPLLGQTLRRELMLIDTSPRWPNPPRFRLKKDTVTTIVREHFGDSLEQLPGRYTSYEDIDATLHAAADSYRGMTIGDIAAVFGIPRGTKQLMEQIVVRMFGGKAKKLGSVELFAKTGVKVHSLSLRASGIKKEDVKMFQIDFGWFDDPVPFEESMFYEYFAESPFIFVVSRLRPGGKEGLSSQEFLGFKRYAFKDGFIETVARSTYEQVADLVVNDKLVLVPELNADGTVKITKSGVVSEAPNFPKSGRNDVFIRGSGTDATKKPEVVNGLRMYRQWVWVHGRYLVGELAEVPWI